MMEMDMSQKTGYFSGHAVAGSGFLVFGFFILCLTLYRVRSLPHDVTFAQAHIPERNSSILTGGGLIIILVTMFGVCFEAPGWDNILAPLTHVSLYFAFMIIGVTALLEGLKRLPQDSVRRSIVFCMILQYVIWNEHAMMKEVPADLRLHELLAQLCLVAAAIVAYSVKYPENVVAYVMQPGISILMGMWLYTGGLYAAYIDIPAGLVGIILCWEALFVALIILLGAALLVPRSYSGNASYYVVPEKDLEEALCLQTPQKKDKRLTP